MHGAAALQVCKLRGEAPSQVVYQTFKHLAEVAILKLEHVDVHQQPEVVVVVHHLLDLPAEAHERFGFERFVNLVKDRAQTAVDGRLVFADDRTEDLLFGPVIVVNVAEGRPCPGGDVAHRGSVKALLNEEFLGLFLDTTFVLLDRAGTEFGHPPIKKRTPVFYLDLTRCQGLISRKDTKENAKPQRNPSLFAPLRPSSRLCVKICLITDELTLTRLRASSIVRCINK